MIEREAEATWRGDLAHGNGTYRAGDVERPYSFGSRFEAKEGSNPEELIGAALTSCFAMALSHDLAAAGHVPTEVNASARVHLDADALAITRVELRTRGEVPNLDEATFRSYAEQAKENCPVARVLAGTEIELVEARLG